MAKAAVLFLLVVALLPACGSGANDSTCTDGDSDDVLPASLREAVRTELERYSKLLRAILDPRDSSVEKKFLVLQPLLGMGNSQIEEVIMRVCVCVCACVHIHHDSTHSILVK